MSKASSERSNSSGSLGSHLHHPHHAAQEPLPACDSSSEVSDEGYKSSQGLVLGHGHGGSALSSMLPSISSASEAAGNSIINNNNNVIKEAIEDNVAKADRLHGQENKGKAVFLIKAKSTNGITSQFYSPCYVCSRSP